jgi:hypothetical protein
MVLFANYRTRVVEIDGKKKALGGQRVLFTTHHPAWDAKNRHGLPELIELPASGLPAELAKLVGVQPAPAKAERKPTPAPAAPVVTAAPLPVDHNAPSDLNPMPAPETVVPPTEPAKPVAKPAAAATQAASDPTAFNAGLYERMKQSGVSDEQLTHYLHTKLKMTQVNVHNLSTDFVARLLKNWDKVTTWINDNQAVTA